MKYNNGFIANAISDNNSNSHLVVAYSLTGVWRRCIRYKTRPVSKDAGFFYVFLQSFIKAFNKKRVSKNANSTTNILALVAISCLAGRTTIVRIQPKSPLDAGFLI
jgi:hypothetical protein